MEISKVLDNHVLTVTPRFIRRWAFRALFIQLLLTFVIAAGSVYGALMWLGDSARAVQVALITTQNAMAKMQEAQKEQGEVKKWKQNQRR